MPRDASQAQLLKKFISSLMTSATQSRIRLEQALKNKAPSKPARHPKPSFHAFSKGEHVNGPIAALFRTIRREEQQAVQSSTAVQYEPRSQDSPSAVLRDDGYEDDGFVIDDELASSTPSSSEDDSLYIDSDDDSLRCVPHIREQLRDSIAKHKPKLTATSPTTATVDRSPVLFRFSCPQYTQFELLFNAWLQTDVRNAPDTQFLLFLETLHSCRVDLVHSVFKMFISRFLPHAKPFVRFVWNCIREAVPQHALAFKLAFEKLYARLSREGRNIQPDPTDADTAPTVKKKAPVRYRFVYDGILGRLLQIQT
jgi:hypothetical protein